MGLGERFSVQSFLGLGLDLGLDGRSPSALDYGGFTPMVELSPRLHVFSERLENGLYKGGFVELQLEGNLPKHSLLSPYNKLERELLASVSLGITPALGWHFPMGERSFLRTSLGLAFAWSRYSYKDLLGGSGHYWLSTLKAHLFPIEIGLSYGWRF